MYNISIAQIKALAANAKGEYLAAFTDPNNTLVRYGIGDRLRVCHFLAQTLAETGGYRVFVESLNYSALRLTQVWPKHFHSIEQAEPYAHNEEALGNYIYGPQIHHDLGNAQPGDGYRFRGRGLLQITGRAAYEKYGTMLNISLADDPDLAYDHRYSLAIAAAEFSLSKYHGKTALELSDADDIVDVTHAVNGGQNGIDQRKIWLQRAKNIFKPAEGGALVAAADQPVNLEGSSRAVANAWRELSA